MTDLDNLAVELRRFAAERDWLRHHTPKNLALAIASEAGELCHCYRWEAEGQETLFHNPAVEAELADVLIFALRLADELHLDVAGIIRSKMAENARKYPAP